jgi:hypothetical protein
MEPLSSAHSYHGARGVRGALVGRRAGEGRPIRWRVTGLTAEGTHGLERLALAANSCHTACPRNWRMPRTRP